MKTTQMSGGKTILHIVVTIVVLYAASMLAGIFQSIPNQTIAVLLGATTYIGLFTLFAVFYSQKVLHLSLSDIRIKKPVVVPVC